MSDAGILFRDGPVLLPGAEHPVHTSVAVRDGRVLAVGQGAGEALGGGAETVDLHGRLLSPAFLDGHVHAVWAGVEHNQCDLSSAVTAAAYLEAIADYAARHRDLPWVSGGGWQMAAFPGGLPHRRQLDAVVPDRPAYFPNRDHHGSWVNTLALRRAGITAATPDPPGGRIERDADGEPTGMLQETAADLVARHLPPITDAETDAGLAAAQQVLHGFGISGWHDALLGDYLGQRDAFDTYVRAEAAGLLTARVVGATWWDPTLGPEQLQGVLERRGSSAGGRFRASAVKIMQDGVIETGTAALLSPYLDRCGRVSSHSGQRFFDPAVLREHVVALGAAGLDVHFHGIGDAAVRDALDAVEEARRRNPNSASRHQIAHVQVVHPDDVTRFAELGVTATIQPLWACHEPQMDELTLPVLGPERSQWQYPFRALHDAGARLAAGSDWAVTSPNPLEGIAVAVTRCEPGTTGPVFLPHQRLSLRQAWDAYTVGTAAVNGWHDIGRIGPGTTADLVLLDRDCFAGAAEDIASTQVLATWVGGRRVHTGKDYPGG